MADELELLGVCVSREVVFAACKDKMPLPFDFLVVVGGRCGLIEFDGLQHFEVTGFTPTEALHQDMQRRDKIKTQFACENAIPFLRLACDLTERQLRTCVGTFTEITGRGEKCCVFAARDRRYDFLRDIPALCDGTTQEIALELPPKKTRIAEIAGPEELPDDVTSLKEVVITAADERVRREIEIQIHIHNIRAEISACAALGGCHNIPVSCERAVGKRKMRAIRIATMTAALYGGTSCPENTITLLRDALGPHSDVIRDCAEALKIRTKNKPGAKDATVLYSLFKAVLKEWSGTRVEASRQKVRRDGVQSYTVFANIYPNPLWDLVCKG